MGLISSLRMSKRQIKKMKPIELDSDKALSFVCDEMILLPVGKARCFPAYRQIDAALFSFGEPLVRLKGGGDVVFVEPSARSFKIDVLAKSGLARVFPTFGRIRVDWDGVDLHVTRLPDGDETL